jgi:hypothetical protein
MKIAMLLATPSPDPRQLMKAPARATLSPKGERAGFQARYFHEKW